MTAGGMTEAARREPSVVDFRHTARSWLAAADVPRLPPAYAGRAGLLRAWHRTLYHAGWVGIQWTREVGGGLGLTVHHQLAFNEELARASVVADIRFDHVHVPDGDVLLAAGGGATAPAIKRRRATLRVMIAAELTELSRHLLDSSVGYAKVHEQFGRPIGSFQPVQQILADMATQVLGLEAFTAECATRQEPGWADAIVLKGACLSSRPPGRRVSAAGSRRHRLHQGIRGQPLVPARADPARPVRRPSRVVPPIGSALLTGDLEP